ncbi:MAG: arginine--tRNA ligase [Betaproteobacteria bacterium]|jgi:arginyl-tRNA synthetase|nr:arginine--tRNA ligase [Betaproteobacteria bacterium]
MLSEHRLQIAARLAAAVTPFAEQAGLATPVITLERPKQASHGDLACSIALQLAKPLGRPPREVAQALVFALNQDPLAAPLVAGAEIAGPGFINLRVTPAVRTAAVTRALHEGADFGRGQRGAGRPLLIEFVSANPTGPLHVGHGRQGALGDVLAALLEADGWAVSREFYYNDAGNQIQNLALSVQARARGVAPDSEAFPEDGYRGEYIAEIAQRFLARESVAARDVAVVVASGDVDDLDAIRRFAVACLRHEQDLDLQAFGIRFDRYYLESSLYTEGRVTGVVDALLRAGHAFEADGALWLRSTSWGDDKDRVMRKSDGTFTYFVPDVAYHQTKWERGFARAINVQGSDHHGTITRVRAGLQALGIGIPQGWPDYVLHQMVTVMRGGEEVKISKRAGGYVTLRDLIDWSGATLERGRDAVRFFLISRKADAEFAFDIDLARSQSDENPVYYVQYAHARICSVLAQRNPSPVAGPGVEPAVDVATVLAADLAADCAADLTCLDTPAEIALMARLAEWPDTVRDSVDELSPHLLAYYLRDLAADFHSFYNAQRVLVDDARLRAARLALLAATRQVLRNGLALIGVSAPQRM